jgi:hypothetical protein
MAEARDRVPVLYTVGHSNGEPTRLLTMLQEAGVELLADVRTVPKSRHVPWATDTRLARWLPANGIAYEHWKDLGGLRHAKADSVNRGWRNASFRGYADYMQTPEFRAAADRLAREARNRVTCIMCAEAVPWRCHRSLLGDAMLVRGFHVVDLIGPGSARKHELTPFARIDGEAITYPEGTPGRRGGSASGGRTALGRRPRAAAASATRQTRLDGSNASTRRPGVGKRSRISP